MNKTIRYLINLLYGFMREKTRMDIYHKYEVIGDLAYSLNGVIPETKLKDLSMQ